MRNKLYKSMMVISIIIIPLLLSCACTKSPSQVVVAAYMAANEGKYFEAEKYMSSEMINAIKKNKGGWKGALTKQLAIEQSRKLKYGKKMQGGDLAQQFTLESTSKTVKRKTIVNTSSKKVANGK